MFADKRQIKFNAALLRMSMESMKATTKLRKALSELPPSHEQALLLAAQADPSIDAAIEAMEKSIGILEEMTNG